MCNQGVLHKASCTELCYRTCCAAAVKFVARKNSKKKKQRKTIEKKRKKKKKGPKGVPPDTSKLIFYIRTVKRIRNEIEAQKKSDFKPPTTKKKNERK